TGYLGITAHWLLEKKPTLTKNSKLIGIYDWIASRLIGGEPTTDRSSAAAWGMYSIRDRKWSNEILEALQIPLSMLPNVADIGEEIGKLNDSFADVLGLP